MRLRMGDHGDTRTLAVRRHRELHHACARKNLTDVAPGPA